jgi:hypothetical protein
MDTDERQPECPPTSSPEALGIVHFWEDFLTAKNAKSTKRQRNSHILIFVFFAFFVVKNHDPAAKIAKNMGRGK